MQVIRQRFKSCQMFQHHNSRTSPRPRRWAPAVVVLAGLATVPAVSPALEEPPAEAALCVHPTGEVAMSNAAATLLSVPLRWIERRALAAAPAMGWSSGLIVDAREGRCLGVDLSDPAVPRLELKPCRGEGADVRWSYKAKWIERGAGAPLVVIRHDDSARILQSLPTGSTAAGARLGLGVFSEGRPGQQFLIGRCVA